MKKYSILLLIAISFISCKSRKVATEISKSTDKTKTEQESHVVTKTDLTKTDLTKIVKTSSDSSKRVEDENVIIKADSISYNKVTGEIKAKGNVQANFKKRTETDNRIKTALNIINDIQANIAKTVDSLGRKEEKKNVTEFKKTKNSESKSDYAWIAILIVIIFVIWALARIWKDRK